MATRDEAEIGTEDAAASAAASSAYAQTSAFVAELFGFSPMVFVDMIIGVVDSVLDNMLGGLENFFKERVPQQKLESGIKELECIFESYAADVLDRVETYMLRNPFHIDEDLVFGGWVRLPAHEGIDFTDPDGCAELAARVEQLEKDIIAEKTALVEIEAKRKEIRNISARWKWIDENLPMADDPAAVDEVRRLAKGAASIEFLPLQRDKLTESILRSASGEIYLLE